MLSMNFRRKIEKITIRLIGATLLVGLFYVSLGAKSALAAVSTQCAPAAGLGMVTTTNFNVPSAGTYKLWVRMKAASSTQNIVALEAQSGNGAVACFDSVGGTGLSATQWQWRLAGEASLAATNNTVIIAGKHANVMVDKVIPVSNSLACDPNNYNVRNTTTGVEPGDACLPVATPTTTITSTISSTPSTTTTIVPTTTITPAPSTTPTPTPSTAPTGPQKLGVYLYYDFFRGRYFTEINYSQTTGAVQEFEVHRDGVVIAKPAASQLSYRDYNIAAEKTYTYQVFAVSGSQRSTGSPKYTATIKCFLGIFCGLQ